MRMDLGEAVDFAALLLVYIIFLGKRWAKGGRDRLFIKTLMYIYLSFVLYFTLMPVIMSLPTMFRHTYTPMSIIPFDDYMHGRGDVERQILLNVLMTIPFGFMLPLVREKKTGFFRTVLFTFLLSLSIELLQPLISFCRASDSTDLITNTLGGVIGYVLYLIFRPLTTFILKKIRGKQGEA